MAWYVVLDGWTPGVFGDRRLAQKSIQGYYDGEDSKMYQFSEMHLALAKYDEYLCNRLKLPPKSSQILHMTQIRYEHMPRHRGHISVIPETSSSYQLIVHMNLKYNYLIYVLYSYNEVFYKITDIPEGTSLIKQYLHGINYFARLKPSSIFLIPEQSIAMAFEQGWIYQWHVSNTPVKDFDLWATTYESVKKHRVNVKHQARYVVANQIIEYVQWEVFKKHYKILKGRNPRAYEHDYNMYCIECNIPPLMGMCVTDTSSLSTLATKL